MRSRIFLMSPAAAAALSAPPAGACPATVTITPAPDTPAPGVTTVEVDAEGVVPTPLFIRMKANLSN